MVFVKKLFRHLLIGSVWLCGLSVLSGCTVVGGLSSSDNTVAIDESTVTPELRQAFMEATKLIFMSAEESDSYMAEYLEVNGGYQVLLEEPPRAASPSQRRSTMESFCSNESETENKTLVIAFSAPDVDFGTRELIRGAFTGRARYEMSANSDVLDCVEESWSQYSVSVFVNQGIYSADQLQFAREVSVAFAQSIMIIAEKPLPVEQGS